MDAVPNQFCFKAVQLNLVSILHSQDSSGFLQIPVWSIFSKTEMLIYLQACSSTLPAIMGLIRSPLLQGKNSIESAVYLVLLLKCYVRTPDIISLSAPEEMTRNLYMQLLDFFLTSFSIDYGHYVENSNFLADQIYIFFPFQVEHWVLLWPF